MSEPKNPPLIFWDSPEGPLPAGSQVALTLRDLFAAAALAGMQASDDAMKQASKVEAPVIETFAKWAYKQADAMLRERAKESR